MLQIVNEKTSFEGKVVVVQPIEKVMCDMLSAQDCKYTHICRGSEGVDTSDMLKENGLSLLNGPGNDIVAVTNLTAAGVHMILFTTGRGTPLGAPVPTIKIATNHNLAVKKANWIDFDASPMLDGVDPTEALLDYCIEIANGKEAKNEINKCEEISIFKDGVVL